MSSPASLPIPALQLMQVGQWKVPLWNATTRFAPEAKVSTTDIYRGPQINFDRNRRGDISQIRVSHEGSYSCCGEKRSCTWAMSEWDGIARTFNMRTKILFYRSPYCLDCPEGCRCEVLHQGQECWHCLRKKLCGEWLWAWGRVTDIPMELSTDDFRAPQTKEVSVEILLDGPLEIATHMDWWYGTHVPITEKCVTREEAAAAYMPGKRYFWKPCGPLTCCTSGRFWPRRIDCGDCLDETAFYTCKYLWDSYYIDQIQNGCHTFFAPGSAKPRVLALFDAGDVVSVRNAAGSYTINYTGSGPVFSDTENGVVHYQPVNTSVWGLMPAALQVFNLEPGENVITTNNVLTFGVTPRWIN